MSLISGSYSGAGPDGGALDLAGIAAEKALADGVRAMREACGRKDCWTSVAEALRGAFVLRLRLLDDVRSRFRGARVDIAASGRVEKRGSAARSMDGVGGTGGVGECNYVCPFSWGWVGVCAQERQPDNALELHHRSTQPLVSGRLSEAGRGRHVRKKAGEVGGAGYYSSSTCCSLQSAAASLPDITRSCPAAEDCDCRQQHTRDATTRR